MIDVTYTPWLKGDPQLLDDLADEVASAGAKYLALCKQIYALIEVPAEIGDADSTWTRMEAKVANRDHSDGIAGKYNDRQGIVMLDHAGGGDMMFIWGTGIFGEVFHIRCMANDRTMEDAFRYEDLRDSGYILSMTEKEYGLGGTRWVIDYLPPLSRNVDLMLEVCFMELTEADDDE
jgi:hypothetical protein